jgi:hypothetical protein
LTHRRPRQLHQSPNRWFTRTVHSNEAPTPAPTSRQLMNRMARTVGRSPSLLPKSRTGVGAAASPAGSYLLSEELDRRLQPRSWWFADAAVAAGRLLCAAATAAGGNTGCVGSGCVSAGGGVPERQALVLVAHHRRVPRARLLAACPVLVGHPLWLDRGIGLRRSSGCRWTGERRDSCGGWVKVGACFGLLGFSFAIGVTRPLPIASAVGGHTSVRATAAKPRSRSCARPARSGCSAKTKPHGRTERERDREQLTPSAQRCSHCGSSSATRTSGHRHLELLAPSSSVR